MQRFKGHKMRLIWSIMLVIGLLSTSVLPALAQGGFTVAITAPTTEEPAYVKGGASVPVEVTLTGTAPSTVDINLYVDGELFASAVGETVTDGVATITIAAPSADGAYDLKVGVKDNAGGNWAYSSTQTGALVVDNTAPQGQLNLTSPVGGEAWFAGSTHDITWNWGSGPDEPYQIEIEYNKAGVWTPIKTLPETGLYGADDVLDPGKYAWTVPGDAVPDTCVRIRAVDDLGNFAAWITSGWLTVRASDSSLTVTVSADPLQVGALKATATAAAGPSGVASVTFYYRLAGQTPEASWTGAQVDTTAPYSASWALADGKYDVMAVVRNGFGEEKQGTAVEDVVLDNQMTVALTTPADGAVVVPDALGNVALSATLTNPEREGPYAVVFFYRAQGAEGWTRIGLTQTVTLINGTKTFTADTKWATSALANGYYELRCYATVGDKPVKIEAEDVNTVWLLHKETNDIVLYSGWNLISSPLIPEDTSLEVVLGDLIANGSVDLVTTFTGGGQMPTESRWEPPVVEQLGTIEDGQGYWFKMSRNDVLTIQGSELPAPPAVPPSYQVYEGWNLIGFKSTLPMEAEEYLGASVVENTRAMYGYDAAAGVYTIIRPYTELQPGSGYWLALDDGGIIYPPGALLDARG